MYELLGVDRLKNCWLKESIAIALVELCRAEGYNVKFSCVRLDIVGVFAICIGVVPVGGMSGEVCCGCRSVVTSIPVSSEAIIMRLSNIFLCFN